VNDGLEARGGGNGDLGDIRDLPMSRKKKRIFDKRGKELGDEKTLQMSREGDRD